MPSENHVFRKFIALYDNLVTGLREYRFQHVYFCQEDDDRAVWKTENFFEV